MYQDKQNGTLIYSPSDLMVFMDSPFASWMERYAVSVDKTTFKPDTADNLSMTLQSKGHVHERKFMETFRADNLSIEAIPNSIDSVAREDVTKAAMQKGAEVVYQGYFRLNHFVGAADFLIKVPGESKFGNYHYEVWAAKLSKQVKPYFVIQLCCYSAMLAEIQGRLPESMCVVLGNNEKHFLRVADYFFYYQNLKQAFLDFHHHFDAEKIPDPSYSRSYGRWDSEAQRFIKGQDHLVQVANIKRSHIVKLKKAGIQTLNDLATTDLTRVNKISDSVFSKLKHQACFQVASQGKAKPQFEVIHKLAENRVLGLQLLPPASAYDGYFNMEGYPLTEGGLEYLFGCCYVQAGKREFIDWWAHGLAQEKLAFENFIDWAFARWQVDNNMHIYHYGHYEVVAMKKLMQKHATRETQVDELLRHQVFVDLGAMIDHGLRIGEPSYSIKNVEAIYRDKRVGGVSHATTSLASYEFWMQQYEAGEQGRDWQTSKILKQLRDDNKDDCDSIFECTVWLRQLQQSAGINWVDTRVEQVTSEEAEEQINRVAQLRDALLEGAQDNSIEELLAYLLEFHHRELKPVFWRRYDWASKTDEELAEDIDCLAHLERTANDPLPEKSSLVYEYAFNPEQESKLHRGSQCLVVNDFKLTFNLYDMNPQQGLVYIKVGKKRELPQALTLIPDEYISPKVLADAVYDYISEWFINKPEANAVMDFLQRRRPRIQGNESGSIIKAGEEMLSAAIDVVSHLQNSTLCIQGPPGAGKSYTASHIIFALLKSGKRVGITSNSHKAVNHLMLAVVKLMDENNDYFPVMKIQSKNYPQLSHEHIEYLASMGGNAGFPTQHQLIGGTAWTFANNNSKDQFDYLFIDEAGQVSIANVVAMGRATGNIVLMGDQMQLGQPIQGSHPKESGLSALEFYLQGHATIPDDLGIFLKTTWRMHPDICKFISNNVYDGRLQAEAHTQNRVIRLPESGGGKINKRAGLIYVPVQHEGNQQASDEEVAEILGITNELIGREHVDKEGESVGALTINDILYVAPYNFQVRKLQTALGEEAKVGSVDKFQGQEAPVVIISLCASSGEDSPRGLDFILDKNRLNVAISRAQSLVVLVASPVLAQSTVSQLKQMELINLFCGYVESAETK